MADNTTLNPGAGGDVYRSDEIGGVKTQAVKVELGADGVSNGFVSTANPLPVSDAGGSITVDGTITVQDGGNVISVDDGAGSLTVDNAVLSVVGGGTEATAQRVTIASDSTGVLSVDDNGGSLSVDDGAGSLTVDAPAGTPVNVQIGDGTRQATVRDTGASDSLNVSIVDASGNQITTFGGGTEYTEDAAAAANPVGGMMIARRRDTPTASEVSADGDNIALITTAEGYLRTAVSGTVSVSDGGGAISVDDNGGSLSVDDNGGSLTVDGTVAVTGIGTGATDIAKVEDASHVTGDVGVMMLAVRRDSATHGVSADGDYAALSVDNTGALRTVGGGGGTQYTEDAVAATDPVGNALIMVRADSLAAVTSTDGDNVAARATNKGELYVKHADTLIARLVDNSGNDVSDDPNNALRVSIVAGGGSGGTAMADDAAFTVGTTNVTPVAGTYKSTRDQVDDNDAGALAMTQKRGLYVSPETPNGDSLADDTADALKVVGAVASGASLSGGPVVTGARAGASAPSDVGADGTAVALRSTRKGELFVTLCDTAGDSCMDGTNDAIRVSIVNGGGTGGTAMTDDAAFTVGSTQVTPVAGTYRASRDQVDDGDAGAFAMTQRRAQLIVPETVGGVAMTDEVNNALKVSLVDAASNLLGVATKDTLFNLSLSAVDAAATVATGGRSVVAFELQGTFVATAQFEASIDDGATWFSVRAFVSGVTPAAVTSATATGRWYAHVAGFSHFRARLSAYTSGTVVVWIGASASPTSQGLVMVGDGGLALSVDDGGSSITIDGSVAAVGAAAHGVPISNNPLCSGGVAWAAAPANVDDGDAVSAWHLRNGAQCVQVTAAGALVGGDATNGLDVDVTRMPGTVTEDAASAGGETSLLIAGVRNDAAASKTSADGDFGNIAIDSAGRVGIADLGGSITVDGTVAVSGTTTTQDTSSLVDNAGFTDGTSRVLPSGFVLDETAGTALTENDVAAARIDSKRAQVHVIEDATTRGQRLAVNSGGALEVHGDVAHDAAVSGNPLLNGYEARTSDGTAVANGDAVRGAADTLGKQVVLVGAVHDLQVRGTATYTNTTASDLVAAAGAGVRIAVMGVIVTNAHATVSTKVEIRDGTTVKVQGYAVAAGGGFVASGGGVPLFISTANTAVTGRCVTTGADVDITVWGYKIGN